MAGHIGPMCCPQVSRIAAWGLPAILLFPPANASQKTKNLAESDKVPHGSGGRNSRAEPGRNFSIFSFPLIHLPLDVRVVPDLDAPTARGAVEFGDAKFALVLFVCVNQRFSAAAVAVVVDTDECQYQDAKRRQCVQVHVCPK